MLNSQEKQIVQFGKENGKTKMQTKAALGRFRKQQTSEQARPAQEPQDSRFLGGTQDALGSVFGGGNIGEAIGTQIAKRSSGGRELQRQVDAGETTQESVGDTLTAPSATEVAGDVGRTALNFAPIGRLAQGAKAVGTALGIGAKTAGVGGNIVAGGATGAAFDVAEDVAENRDIGLGGGTIFGAGLPVASPIIGAIGRATAKGAGFVGREITGALTGTSAETLEQAFFASKAGGKDLNAFTNSMRGKTTPEGLANALTDNIGIVNQKRQTLFKATLQELGGEIVETNSAKVSFQSVLDDAKIAVKEDGTLDFSNSGKLKLVKQAQTKVEQAYEELLSLPPTATLEQVDDARQAIKALSLTGDDPSAKLGNKIIDDAVRSVRAAGEDVTGYGQMLDEFGETSSFLEEIQRGLSAKDTATIDQTYRRMATALKTNNEQRMALVRELDEVTDGAILSGIAGQQLNEFLPRGIFRQIAAGIAGGAAITGTVSPALIPALVLASPRIVGEFVRSLGIGAAKADIIIESIKEAQSVLIKAGIIVSPGDE